MSKLILLGKQASVKTNSGQIHLKAAGHEGADVFAHVARSAQMHLEAVIFNRKQPTLEQRQYKNDSIQSKIIPIL